MYIEMTLDEAERYLKKSKNKKVLVALQNLEENSVQEFSPKLKEDCLEMIRKAETFAKCCGDMVDTLNAFSKKQNLKKIRREGSLITVLIHPSSNLIKRE